MNYESQSPVKMQALEPVSGTARRLSDVLEGSPFRERISAPLQRFRKRQLLRYGAYQRLRSLLPILVLGFVWVIAAHEATFPFHLQTFLNATVNLRHLLLGLSIAVLWNLIVVSVPHQRVSLREDLRGEIVALVRGSIFCGAVLFLGHTTKATSLYSAWLGLELALAFLAGSLLLFLGACLLSAAHFPWSRQLRKAIIIGSGPRAALLRSLAQSNHDRLEIFGCLDDAYVGNDAGADRYLGDLQRLPELLKAEPIELVLIGLPVRSHYEQIQGIIEVCETVGVESHYMQDIFVTRRTRPQVAPSPTEFVALGNPPKDLRHWIKRGVDLLVSGTMLVLLAPLLAAIAIAIKLTSTGPVLFMQQRYGQSRRLFPMLKFRTMVPDAEKLQAGLEAANEAQGPVFKMKADPRVTRVGAFLRKTSLDELPQLINVLRGDMTLVGPRPLPMRDVSRFSEAWLLRRFSVRPGLTCLWQVRGRSNTMFDEWMRLDLEYIDSWTLALDFQILARTIPAVLRGSGAM